ncbi:uncharacterized protein CTRU02_214354 [Colletotrichum truncatum]|uniref:Uncharacterized protein n=1 Tax=Colletotrichum truncatum TaxID=5467 RepID=A0ACC3YEI9_COLTU|nr:uncharacterized protein CTRU02_13542 [Colletotrichum truncatum]KAF6783306.1 hypothetical protein CTRU02_13542 [Colletotrichum truncatum]
MPSPSSNLFGHENISENQVDTTSAPDFTPATTATIMCGDNSYNGIGTPSPTSHYTGISTISNPADNGFQDTTASSLALPDPTIILYQIQKAAEDVSQLVGRFGDKMAKVVQRSSIKMALFTNRKSLRLPCLQYADYLTCRVTKLNSKQPIDHTDAAPLLWWLWDDLLDYIGTSVTSKDCHLKFTPARETNIDTSYTISINLSSKNGNKIIELTASYGGPFHERRIFDATTACFRFPPKERYGKPLSATLDVDKHPYTEKGCCAHTFDYLMPRPESMWRHAMENFPLDGEEALVVALIGTFKANSNYYMSNNEVKKWLNLFQRFPAEARAYVDDQKLVGK